MRSDAGCEVIGTLFGAQHDRHLARLVNERQVIDGISPASRSALYRESGFAPQSVSDVLSALPEFLVRGYALNAKSIKNSQPRFVSRRGD
jgi:hypothetical protein